MPVALQVNFLDNVGAIHPLLFNIIDSDLARRWIEITKKNQAVPEKYIFSRLANVTYKHMPQVRKRLTDTILAINSIYDEPLPTYDDIEWLTTTELNYLHEEFERYGERMNELIIKKNNWSRPMHEDFLQLNELIHLHEDVNSSRTHRFPIMGCLYDYYPQEFHAPILESDKKWLTPNFQWGDLFLGYNTLGKDWMKVQIDNDLEVIERVMVKPQKRFAAETWINFGSDSSDYFAQLRFEQWVNSLPEHIRKRVPDSDLNKLTYGRFKIGSIVCDQNYFYKYNADPAQWRLPSSQAKLDWNMNVYSTFVKVDSIKFHNV